MHRRLAYLPRIGLLAAVGAALPSLLGCLDHPLKPVEYDKAQEESQTVDLAVNKDVDILFVIDNSGSMGEEQGTLAANFSNFISVLEQEDVAANYRIGITTTDNGNPQCNGTTPEGGKLRLSSCRSRESEFTFTGTNPPTVKYDEACAAVCPDTLANLETVPTATDNDPDPKSRAWIENIEGQTNLPDGVTTTQAFQCFGPQGINGCGFESPLESMWKSLLLMEQSNSPNFDFRRPNAILGVVIVTDEADCSLDPDYGTIFDPNGSRTFWSDPNSNFPTSAVCWNAGVKCEGGPGTYTSCDPVNKDADGNEGVSDDKAVLFPLSKYIDLLQSIENDQQDRVPGQQVIVAGIVGVPDGYSDPTDIEYKDSSDQQFQNDFGIGPGCTSTAGTAVPPVRIRDFAQAFEVSIDGQVQPNLFSICNDDYSNALQTIANIIASQVKPACMQQCVADTDPSTDNYVEPLCSVEELVPGENGVERRPIPACVLTCGGTPCTLPGQNPDGWEFPTDATACYRLLVDKNGVTGTDLDDMSQECIDDGWNLEFKLERSAAAPGGTTVQATCQLSQAQELDCPDL